MTCTCGIATNQKSGICQICDMEDRNPQLHIDLGIYRVRFSLGQEPQPEYKSRHYGARYRKDSCKRAALEAGRRTTMRAYMRHGSEIIRLHLNGMQPIEIWARMKERGARISQSGVDYWIRRHKSMAGG